MIRNHFFHFHVFRILLYAVLPYMRCNSTTCTTHLQPFSSWTNLILGFGLLPAGKLYLTIWHSTFYILPFDTLKAPPLFRLVPLSVHLRIARFISFLRRSRCSFSKCNMCLSVCVCVCVCVWYGLLGFLLINNITLAMMMAMVWNCGAPGTLTQRTLVIFRKKRW